MTAPAVTFDEWLTEHLDETVTRFHYESRDDCVWLFMQFAQEQYMEAAANFSGSCLYPLSRIETGQAHIQGERDEDHSGDEAN